MKLYVVADSEKKSWIHSVTLPLVYKAKVNKKLTKYTPLKLIWGESSLSSKLDGTPRKIGAKTFTFDRSDDAIMWARERIRLKIQYLRKAADSSNRKMNQS